MSDFRDNHHEPDESSDNLPKIMLWGIALGSISWVIIGSILHALLA